MKNRSSFFLVCLFFAMVFVAWGMENSARAQTQPDMAPQPQQGGQAPDSSGTTSLLKTQKEQVNYAIGVNLIGNFKKQGIDIDLNMVMKGMQDAAAGEKLLMSDNEINRALKQYYAKMRQGQAKIVAMTAEENRKEGDAFLAENGKKEGVVILPSGLQYRIIQKGDGKKPTATDTVEIQYRGRFINGHEFDSSYRTGQPATLKVKDVIPGWQEALSHMPAGSAWEIFVPSSLAYGAKGKSGSIGPNTALVFEIKLLAIK